MASTSCIEKERSGHKLFELWRKAELIDKTLYKCSENKKVTISVQYSQKLLHDSESGREATTDKISLISRDVTSTGNHGVK